jgi:hypothetical protein
VLQSEEEERPGHTTPPWATSVMMERDLVLVPKPQDLVQAPKADHSETTQFTEQANVLQLVAEDLMGHLTPL